jgi:hypothetical protein
LLDWKPFSGAGVQATANLLEHAEPESFVAQVVIIERFLPTRKPMPSFESSRNISLAWDTIKSSIHGAQREKKTNGSPPLLMSAELQVIAQPVGASFNVYIRMKYEELLEEVEHRFSEQLFIDSLVYIVVKLSFIKSVAGRFMNASRVHCKTDISTIDLFYAALEHELIEIPAKLVYNLNESGFCDWTDTHCINVLVPSDYAGNEVNLRVDRNSKRLTALVAIKANGGVLKPHIVVKRNTVEEELCAIR